MDEEVSWLYTKINRRRRPDYGEGFVYVTTVLVNPLVAVASATPGNIALGETSQLDVAASGGTPPYTYIWMSDPNGQIAPGDANLQNPVVAPTVDTVYTVAVTDDDGDVTTDSVSVAVGMTLAVSATPATISLGDSSQLEAVVSGGAPPYNFNWIPVATLDDSTIATPVATPVNTQLYEVTVTDMGSNMAVETVTVNVQIELTVTATPDTIDAGDTTQLNVSVAGGRGPYTYQWDPADGLDVADSQLADPFVSPAADTTYTVTVTDADTFTAVGTVDVTVIPAVGLAACYTVTPDPPVLNMGRELWDSSCSVGDGLEYRWVFSIPALGSGWDMCYGAGATPDGWQDSPCPLFDFSPNLQTMEFGFEGESGYVRRVTLYVKDSVGNIEEYYQEWYM